VTVAALALAVVALFGVLTIAVADRRRRRRDTRPGNNGGFVAWDWPQRPVNGHDHPEPPELLEEEPAA